MCGAAILFLTLALASGADAREPVEGGWRLVWSDEFEGRAIDRGKWDFDVACWGGGNSERQCYTARPANAAVRDGQLVITPRTEAKTGGAPPVWQRADPAKAEAGATKPIRH